MAGGTRRNVAAGQNPPNPIPHVQPPIVPPADAMAMLAQLLVGQHAQQQQQHAAQLEQQAVRDAAAAAAVDAANAQTLALAQAMQQIANNAAQPRSNRKLKEFTGTEREDVDDWIESVDREAAAGNWTPETKLNNAKAALRGSASRWQSAPADAGNWLLWSTSFSFAFRKKYTMQQWFELVQSRKQRQNEPAAQYALEIQRLQKFCPHPVEESLLVKYAISGIIHTQFSSVLLHYLPETMLDFARIYGAMEVNAAFAPPSISASSAQLSALEAKFDQQTEIIERQGARLAEFQRKDRMKTVEKNNTASSSRPEPYPAKEGRRSLPSTKCNNCNEFGHWIRDCPKPLTCFNCNKSGHFARECTVSSEVCQRCGSADHVQLDCPKRRIYQLDNRVAALANTEETDL